MDAVAKGQSYIKLLRLGQSFALFWRFKIHRWKNGKFKRMLTFLFVDKGKFCGAKLSFEEFNLVFFPAGLACFEMQQQGSEVFEADFQVHLVLCGR